MRKKNLLVLVIAMLAIVWGIVPQIWAQPQESSANAELCQLIGEGANCSLPMNLQAEVAKREAQGNLEIQGGDFIVSIRDSEGPTNWVGLNQPLTVDMFVKNSVNAVQTGEISHTILSDGLYNPVEVTIGNSTVASNGFTSGKPVLVQLSTGEEWRAHYSTRAEETGFHPTITEVDFGYMQARVFVQGVWALDISAIVKKNQIRIHNPNESLHGGNWFFYRLVTPSGVTSDLDEGEMYLAPGEEHNISAHIYGPAGTHIVAVQVFESKVEWDQNNQAQIVPGDLIYEKQLLVGLDGTVQPTPTATVKAPTATTTVVPVEPTLTTPPKKHKLFLPAIFN